MRGEVVVPALVWPFVTKLSQGIDRSVDHSRVGTSTLEDVVPVILTPTQPAPKPFDMLEQTEILRRALLAELQLPSGLSNRDVRSDGPTPHRASDVQRAAHHLRGGAAGCGPGS